LFDKVVNAITYFRKEGVSKKDRFLIRPELYNKFQALRRQKEGVRIDHSGAETEVEV
jgi:uncharacterized linocin/CFP29 family protein